jgi:thioredoxin-dependent peroxiredoxin
MVMPVRSALVALAALVPASVFAGEKTPAVGKAAPDFELAKLDGTNVKLSQFAEAGPVVLVVLRGYPGYQCPLCTRQVGELLGKADEFKTAKATVVFVYPGPTDALTNHATAFFKNQKLPGHVTVVVDPDYTFTNAYDLRWNARAETAYPSTFVLDQKRTVLYRKVSKTHGDRAPIADVLKALPKS